MMLARAPFPHAEGYFLRQRIAYLACQHCDLAPVMRVVRDEVAEKASHIGTKAFNATITCQGSTEQAAQCLTALLERLPRLRWSDRGSVKLRWNLCAFGGNFQPHHTHIVHMGDDCGNGAAFPVERFCPPCLRGNAIDQI